MRKTLLISALLLIMPSLATTTHPPVFISKTVRDPLTRPDPDAKIWEKVKAENITLMPQQITIPSIDTVSTDTVSIKSVNNGESIAFRLEWKDDSPDDTLSIDGFRDAIAIQFPLEPYIDNLPSPFMGNIGGQVHIVQWKADWQSDIDKGYKTTKDVYPNMWNDHYPFEGDKAMEDRFIAGRAAGNIISNDNRVTPVESLMAEGFGTLTLQKNQNAGGKGVWERGRWKVVIVLPMKARSETEANITPGMVDDIAIAVWNGGNKERGSLKAFSFWTEFGFE